MSNLAPTSEPEHAGWQLEIPLPAEPGAAKTARDAIRAQVGDLSPDVLDDVVLIVSELVSNAVQHGRPEIVLRARTNPLSIDVSVLDHGSDLPSRDTRRPDSAATSGRGLAIVDTLAERWGIDPLGDVDGKTVWATLGR